MAADSLDLFLPPVRDWFRSTLGEPTPAQRQGWPAIAAGHHTLILAPTGSGKTLAAFLACLDQLWRHEPLEPGVRVLYVSPLKALNHDIQRNLQGPLAGVAEAAARRGQPVPAIAMAVRTGDTPLAERQRLLRRPPHVLITTPESLHLLLTSRARDTLRGLTHCIVDEIHALCPNKRGVFLSLLLERLEAINPRSFVRIGLSATQRPLEEVARFLGGQAPESPGDGALVPRPVTIVDAGWRKDLDLRVVSPVEHFQAMPERSVWPAIYRLLRREIAQHRSTIVFANNRRTVERITSQLNEENGSDPPPPAPEPPAAAARLSEPMARAHHGSIALEVRRQTEHALKEGRLRAVVATASLELGIDMGAVDLVCQVESPGNVARGLQRVGRAGHLVGQRSKGRLVPKTLPDLLEQAVLAHEMAAGRVEALHVPVNCLDVLAQQVVAMTAMEPWDVAALYALVRRAYPFRDLTPAALDGVLEMISGRYRFHEASHHRGTDVPRVPILSALQPRVSWDRVHHRLLALPGSQQLALVSGGTIPDTGQFAVYTGSRVRIGELDEEFVYERRRGDTFLLGTNAWRIQSIETDRVLVAPAEGTPALVPFWHGEPGGRSYDLGKALGAFLRTLAQRLDAPDTLDWLQHDYLLDTAAAQNLQHFVRRQLAAADCLPTDETLVVEASRDQLGDWLVLVLTPFGNRLHFALQLAIEKRLSARLGYRPSCLHHNDGILIRLTDTDEPVLDVFEGLTPDNVETLILEELADSPLFALRFRQNAARALLLPRGQPGRRAPLWLQRLRGRDLLQVARQHPDFPIVAETFRECLHDHLDVPRVQALLRDLRRGAIQVRTRRAETPSPFAAGLIFAFQADYMYDFDRTEPDPGRAAPLDHQLLEELVRPEGHGRLLDPRAVHQVERRLRGVGRPPRSSAEMAEWLRRLGDVAAVDLEGPMEAFLQELENDGRAQRIVLSGTRHPQRWVLTEEAAVYQCAFAARQPAPEQQPAAETILTRFLSTHALVSLRDVLERYPFDEHWLRRRLEEWSQTGRVRAVQATERRESPREPPGDSRSPLAPEQWTLPENLQQIQRGSLAILRNEVVTVPPPQFADFLLRWQYLHPDSPRSSAAGLADVLARLEGLPVAAELWETQVLPARVPGYQPRWLDESCAGGAWTWACAGHGAAGPGVLAFWQREHVAELAAPPPPEPALSAAAERTLELLQHRGASFLVDLAQETGLPPSDVRAALWSLLRCRLVSNDSFDVIRRADAWATRSARGNEPSAAGPRGAVGLSSLRRRSPGSARGQIAEGRWALIPWGHPDPESQAVFQAGLLLRRYGVAARELALLDPWLLPWRVLYEVLSRMELAGAVRRGYFVEGLSGAQFALPEAARLLQEVAFPSTAAAPVVLVHSLDPANLYGAGAPFDIPLLEGGTRPLARRAGSWLVLRAGRPLLIVEQQGKRLTALPSASAADLAAAVAKLPALLPAGGFSGRHKVTVSEWNGQPVTATVGKELLEAAGFVRDYQEMTLYGTWR